MIRLWTLFLFMILGSNAYAAGLTEQQKIDSLLVVLAGSDVTFIRHDQEFPAPEGKKFLEDKLKVTDPKPTTAKDFITNVATGGKVTGKPYYIKTKDGAKEEAGKWFTEQLAIIEKANGKAVPAAAAPVAEKAPAAEKAAAATKTAIKKIKE